MSNFAYKLKLSWSIMKSDKVIIVTEKYSALLLRKDDRDFFMRVHEQIDKLRGQFIDEA